MNNTQFMFLQIYGSYLLDYEHNTYEEIMNMTFKEVKDRYFEVIKRDQIKGGIINVNRE